MNGRLALAIVGIGVLAPSQAGAQSRFDPRLQTAIDLAQSGRADSARALVRRLLASLSPQDSVYPEALYVQGGMLAPDAATAATSLQRVAVEYGSSAWADDALLRLSQLYEAQNDPASAVQQVERLRRDYPGSPLLPRAEFVGARAAFDLRDAARACGYIRDAQAGAGDDVELQNQVAFYAARCPTPAAGAPTPDSAAPAQGPTRYAVQVLAGKSAPEVDALLTRLKGLGYDVHVVRDTSGYLKVRVGRYASRDEAQRNLGRLKAQLGGQPFIVVEP
jgi:septal ring-binding cell division protein DamX